MTCAKHGGGRTCDHEGCNRMARPGKRQCISHGGGTRCSAYCALLWPRPSCPLPLCPHEKSVLSCVKTHVWLACKAQQADDERRKEEHLQTLPTAPRSCCLRRLGTSVSAGELKVLTGTTQASGQPSVAGDTRALPKPISVCEQRRRSFPWYRFRGRDTNDPHEITAPLPFM